MPLTPTADPPEDDLVELAALPAGRRAADPATFGLPRGYQPPADARPLLKAASRTRVARSTATAAFDTAAMLVLGLAGGMAWATLGWPAALAVSVVVVALLGRFGRALECMVHEASHRNWQRHGALNDSLANVLAGFPSGTQVEGYRRQHLIHHAHLGSRDDPDILRYEEFDLEGLSGLGGRRLAGAVARRLPRYNWGWYVTIGTNQVTLLWSGLWYAVVVGGLAAVANLAFALVVWLHWLLGFALVLPTIRMIGEAGEHRYEAGDTVFNATISNLGWWHRWLIHPHNDGHHTLHHLWSSVPHHQLGRMHRELAAVDRGSYGASIPWRAKVLENPRFGLDG